MLTRFRDIVPSASLGAAIAAVLVAGCSSSYRPASLRAEGDTYAIVPTTTMGLLEGRATVSMPIPIPGRDTVLVPFSIEEAKRPGQDRDPYTRGGYANEAHETTPWQTSTYNGGAVRWHNAIVRVRNTDEEWLILDRRGVIGWWMAVGPPIDLRQKPTETDALVFLATVEDSNRDNLLNDKDATVAIVTDGDGRNPRTVTPAGSQVWNVTYDAGARRLFMYVVRDTSGNERFGPEDLAVPHSLTLGDGASQAIVTDSAIERARRILSLPAGYAVP